MQQILVPLDTSETARAALPIARALAVSTNGGALRSLLGSVADEVVRRCRRPVLLVQRTARKQSIDASFTEPATFAS
jgi:nucleotide-binding universal stress UspA family protein